MFRKIHFLIICFIFGFLFHCFANETDTEGQRKLLELNAKVESRLRKEEFISDYGFWKENLIPLLKEVVTNGRIWDDDKPVEKLPSLQSFLARSVGSHSNPYFRHALSFYISSERFKNGDVASKQKTCLNLLKMLNDKDYSSFHPFIYKMFFIGCWNGVPFNEESKNLAQDIIMEKRDKFSIHLLFFLNINDLKKETLDYVREKAAEYKNVMNKDSAIQLGRVLKHKTDLVPLVCSVFLAREENQEAAKRLLDSLHDYGKLIDYATADFLFPYMVLVKRRETVLMLAEYLKDDTVIDLSECFAPRYTGRACLAAIALQAMVEGFPKVLSNRAYKEEDRLECLKWLENNPQYKFKESLDWNNDSDILGGIFFLD